MYRPRIADSELLDRLDSAGAVVTPTMFQGLYVFYEAAAHKEQLLARNEQLSNQNQRYKAQVLTLQEQLNLASFRHIAGRKAGAGDCPRPWHRQVY